MPIVPTLPLPEPLQNLSSGVVGVEVLETIRIIEHAARRCGKLPSVLTAEDLETAKTNLHLILASLSNRGVNLWAVDRQAFAVVRGQSTYTLPTGTEKIVNMVLRSSTRLGYADRILGGLSNCSITLEQVEYFHTVGFKLPNEFKGRLVMEYTENGTTWNVHRNFDDITLGKGWHWYSFEPALKALAFRIRNTTNEPLEFEDMLLSNSVNDREVIRYNRDQYTGIPNKHLQGVPSCYFFDKQIESQINIWPVPVEDDIQLLMWRQRRIQDVGYLSEKLEVPERWFEAIVWALAKNLCFELQGVPEVRIQMCTIEAAKALEVAELGESDQAPMYIQPNISGYTA